jgi:hypothetical protein
MLEELQEFPHTCCAIFTNIVCFCEDGERALRNVAVTLSRKSAIVAAISVDL